MQPNNVLISVAASKFKVICLSSLTLRPSGGEKSKTELSWLCDTSSDTKYGMLPNGFKSNWINREYKYAVIGNYPEVSYIKTNVRRKSLICTGVKVKRFVGWMSLISVRKCLWQVSSIQASCSFSVFWKDRIL